MSHRVTVNVTIDTKALCNWQVIVNGRISGKRRASPEQEPRASALSQVAVLGRDSRDYLAKCPRVRERETEPEKGRALPRAAQ